MLQQTCDPFSGKTEAILRFGGLEELYDRSVERFRSNYRDSTALLLHLVLQERYEDAKILAHSLKGLAATLGMLDLHSCSEAVERAIKEGRYMDLPFLLHTYETSLCRVIQSSAVHNSPASGTGFCGMK